MYSYGSSPLSLAVWIKLVMAAARLPAASVPLLESVALIGCHRRGLLLHRCAPVLSVPPLMQTARQGWT